jgi:predicted RNase H-like HicB family nuclease
MREFFRARTPAENGEFQVVVEQEADGTFAATSPALPGYVAYGQSEAAATRRLQRAIQRNLEGFAADYDASSEGGGERTSRHRSRLHFQLPLTLTAKVVIGSLAVAGAIALLSYGTHRRRSR